MRKRRSSSKRALMPRRTLEKLWDALKTIRHYWELSGRVEKFSVPAKELEIKERSSEMIRIILDSFVREGCFKYQMANKPPRRYKFFDFNGPRFIREHDQIHKDYVAAVATYERTKGWTYPHFERSGAFYCRPDDKPIPFHGEPRAVLSALWENRPNPVGKGHCGIKEQRRFQSVIGRIKGRLPPDCAALIVATGDKRYMLNLSNNPRTATERQQEFVVPM